MTVQKRAGDVLDEIVDIIVMTDNAYAPDVFDEILGVLNREELLGFCSCGNFRRFDEQTCPDHYQPAEPDDDDVN